MDDAVQLSGNRARCSLVAALLLAWLACLTASLAHAADKPTGPRKHFDLEAGDASLMLNEFSRQSDLQVLFDFNLLRGLKTHGVTGDLWSSDALARMLKGIHFKFDYVNDHTVALTPEPPSALKRLWRKLKPKRKVPAPDDELEEVLVSGASRAPSVVPALGAYQFTADFINIEQSGASTTQEFLRTVPQIFGGGPTEDTMLGREALTNVLRGSGVNVRGFDAGATLVLVNGLRIAPSGSSAGWGDVTKIPLSAVERIDLLPDGAGALYGADAIGGIINFKLRSTFEGLQTQARMGSVTNGPVKEWRFGQLAGHSWDGGNGLFSLEYYDRDSLFGRDRAQATSNLLAFGGGDFNSMSGNPGTLLSGGQTYAIPFGQNGTGLSAASLVPGTVNETDRWKDATVLPRERRISALASVRQALGDHTTFFIDALGADRTVFSSAGGFTSSLPVPASNPFLPSGFDGPVTVLYDFARDLGNLDTRARAVTGNFFTGVDWEAGGDWTIRGTAGYSLERDHAVTRGYANPTAVAAALADSDPATALNPFADGSVTNPTTLASIRSSTRYDGDSRLKLFQLHAGGSVLALPAGNAKLMAGLDYRDQTFSSTAVQTESAQALVTDVGRHVVAGFAELRVPVFSANHRLPGLEDLGFSAAIRNEHYSDVGGATTPQFGFTWAPISPLSFRGTWAKLFRAPNLPDRVENTNFSALANLPNPAAAAQYSPVLLWGGNNSSLTAEQGHSWTLGFDFKSEEVPGLAFGLTYFNTHSQGRVVDRELPLDIFSNPLYSAWLIPNPTPAQQAAVCDNSAFRSVGSCLNTPVSAIVDLRLHNAGTLISRGIDFNAQYLVPRVPGQLKLGLLATDLLQYSRADYTGGPLLSVLSTQSEPINFRARGDVSWAYHRFGVVGFVNFQNSYRQFPTDTTHTIASWTTADLHLSYDFTESREHGSGTQVALHVENLFNRSSPFVNNAAVGIGYDQENGDLLGRLVSLSLKYQW